KIFLRNTSPDLIGSNGVTPFHVLHDLALGSFFDHCFPPAGNFDCPATVSQRESRQMRLVVRRLIDHQGLKIFLSNAYYPLIGAKDADGVSALDDFCNLPRGSLRERDFFSARNLDCLATAF